MNESLWTPGAEVVSVDRPRRFRGRGDRRGFEPLAPVEALPPPDKDAEGWRVGSQAGPIWIGQPVDKLLVDLSHGGLGDAIRQVAVLRAAVRCGRVKRPIVACRPGASKAWLTGALHPVPVVTVGHLPAEPPDAVLPPIHMIPQLAWAQWPIAPLTSLVAHLLRLPLESLAGPCLNLDPRELTVLGEMLGEGGWMGEPVIAVQTDTHPVGPDLTVKLRNEKVPTTLDAAIPHLVANGCFVVRVGAEAAESSVGTGYGVVDLGGSSISRMAAALFLADLAVTGDSGPMHLAAALGTPVAALFGPSDPALHVCAAGTIPVTPPPHFCDKLHCGKGSLLGGPLEADNATRVPLPCPPEGGCLTRMTGEAVARAALTILANVGPAKR